MGRIKVTTKGNFKHIEKFLNRVQSLDPTTKAIFEKYGQIGVDRLSKATPVDTGLTAASWYYEIEETKDGYILHWSNSNISDGYSVALLIQLGHGTTGGTYVQGIDYINPALEDILKDLADALWREVTK